MLETFAQALDFLYSRLPMFSRVGAIAYKKDLGNTLALLEGMDNPHLGGKYIHVAGTNGKGSVSHALASVLQGVYPKVGLYTSPHLVHLGERIRIQGIPIKEEVILEFLNTYMEVIEKVEPSFFELTVALAFWHFKREKVDIAIIETGLGGRLDSTNVITPLLSIITNIDFDHKDLLGDTLEAIAGEKAGIIKRGVPVIFGQTHLKALKVLVDKADDMGNTYYYAPELYKPISAGWSGPLSHFQFLAPKGWSEDFYTDLRAKYQFQNICTVLGALHVLQVEKLIELLPLDAISQGLENVKTRTGLQGRMQYLGSTKPQVILDVAHNPAGISALFQEIKDYNFRFLHIIYATVKDKDLDDILWRLPPNAKYYLTQMDIPRSMSAQDLKLKANSHGLPGEAYTQVADALQKAKSEADEEDLILVTGSLFLVGEVLGNYQGKSLQKE